MFHVCLRRMCTLLLFDAVFCICLLGPFGLKYSSSPKFPFDFLFLFIFESGVLKSSIIVLLCMSPFRSVSICLIYLGVWMLRTYIIYDCYIFLMNWLLYHYIMTFFVSSSNFWFKIYFVWNMYSHPYSLLVSTFMEYLFLFLHFEPVSLKLKWAFCRQHIVGSCFLNQPVTLWLWLFAELNPFTLRLIIDR